MGKFLDLIEGYCLYKRNHGGLNAQQYQGQIYKILCMTNTQEGMFKVGKYYKVVYLRTFNEYSY